jgi:hypothetical protein
MQGLNATALNGVARAALLGESEKKFIGFRRLNKYFLVWDSFGFEIYPDFF